MAEQAAVLLGGAMVWLRWGSIFAEFSNTEGGRAFRRGETGRSPARKRRSAEALFASGIFQGASAAFERLGGTHDVGDALWCAEAARISVWLGARSAQHRHARHRSISGAAHRGRLGAGNREQR